MHGDGENSCSNAGMKSTVGAAVESSAQNSSDEGKTFCMIAIDRNVEHRPATFEKLDSVL